MQLWLLLLLAAAGGWATPASGLPRSLEAATWGPLAEPEPSVEAFQGPADSGCASCPDAPPPGGDCIASRDTGNCFATFMVASGYCSLTCGRCSCPGVCYCTDVPPDGGFTCAQQAAFGKCNQPWILPSMCRASCGRCSCTGSAGSYSSSDGAVAPQLSAPAPAPRLQPSPPSLAPTLPLAVQQSPTPSPAQVAALQGLQFVGAAPGVSLVPGGVPPQASTTAGAASASLSGTAQLVGTQAAPAGASPASGTALPTLGTGQLAAAPPATPQALALTQVLAAPPPAAQAPGPTNAPSTAVVVGSGNTTTLASLLANQTAIQQLVQPLYAAVGTSGVPTTARPSMSRAPSPPPCKTDLLNYLRSGQDTTLFLSLGLLTGWLQRNLSAPTLAGTLLLPTDTAISDFLTAQGISPDDLVSSADQLESVLAYHWLPKPLTYADLARSPPGALLPTGLPGSFLAVLPLNATALQLVGAASSADIVRANILVCTTVVHFIDAVLQPAPRLDQVLSYPQAVEGLQAPAVATPSPEPGAVAMPQVVNAPPAAQTPSPAAPRSPPEARPPITPAPPSPALPLAPAPPPPATSLPSPPLLVPSLEPAVVRVPPPSPPMPPPMPAPEPPRVAPSPEAPSPPMPAPELPRVAPSPEAPSPPRAPSPTPPLSPPTPAPPPSPPACYHSLAAAMSADPQLSIWQAIANLSGINLTDPTLSNTTVFAIADPALQLVLGQSAQTVLGPAAVSSALRDTQALRDLVQRAIVPQALTVQQLRSMNGQAVPSVDPTWNVIVSVRPNTTDPQAPPLVYVRAADASLVGIWVRSSGASDAGQAVITRGDVRTCGGAILHVVDLPTTPATAAAGQPATEGAAGGAPLPEAPAPSARGSAPAATEPAPPPSPPAVAGPAVAATAPGGCAPSLAAAVASNPQLATLHNALGMAGLNLSDPGFSNFTLFAPLDAAIQRSIAKDELSRVPGGQIPNAQANGRVVAALISFVLVPEHLTLEQLRAMGNNTELPTLLEGQDLRVQLLPNASSPQSPPQVEISGGRVVLGDICIADGSILHIIDAVPVPSNLSQLDLAPQAEPYISSAPAGTGSPPMAALPAQERTPPAAVAPGGCAPSLAAAVASNPQLTILQTALGIASFDLSDPALANVTLFAPLDAALLTVAARGQLLQARAAQNSRVVAALISFFLVPEELTLEQLRAMGNNTELPTLLEVQDLRVQLLPNASSPQAPPQVVIGGGRIVQGDICIADGSILHIIDAVPVPSNLSRLELAPQAAAASAAAAPAGLPPTAAAPTGPQLPPPGAAGQPLPAAAAPAQERAPPAAPAQSPMLVQAADNSNNLTQLLSSSMSCLPIGQFYSTAPEFQSLYKLVAGANLLGLFSPSAATQTFRLTTFAPVNSAIDSFLASLDPSVRTSLVTSSDAMVSLFSYLVVLPPPVMLADMTEGRKLPTFSMDAQGNNLMLTVHRPPGGAIQLQGTGTNASVLYGDIPVCEGVIHAVDNVLLPVRLPGSGASPPPHAASAGSG